MNFKLNYEGFDNYLLGKGLVDGGIHYVFRFENGYGASVVKGPRTYGGLQDLWELAVIEFFGERSMNYELDYDTEITDDVCGYKKVD